MATLTVQEIEATLVVSAPAPTFLVAALDPPLVLTVAPVGATLAVTVAQAGVATAPAAQGAPGPQGPKGDKGDPGAVPVYTAAAVLSGEKALMFAGAGLVVPADPTAPGYVYAGIALNAAQLGGTVSAATSGDVAASFWSWLAGLPVFVASGGSLTQSPPVSGRSHIIGWALDAITIHLTPDPPIPIV